MTELETWICRCRYINDIELSVCNGCEEAIDYSLKDGWICSCCPETVQHPSFKNCHSCGRKRPPNPTMLKPDIKVCPRKHCPNYNKPVTFKQATLCKCGSKLKTIKGGLLSMQWWTIFATLIKSSSRLMLVGPPGTGKSTTANKILGKHTQRLTMTEGTGVEDLLGMFHLVKGETVWKDGPAARAMRFGSPLVLDEIDKYSPEVGSLLYALLDDDPQVVLPSGEYLKAEEGYIVVATSNANVSALPEAILDRMEAILIAATPHPDAMTNLARDERAAVENHYAKSVKDTWKWSGTSTLRRMRAYNKFINCPHGSKLGQGVVAEAVFGTTGKEIVSVLATAARTKEAL